MTTETETIREVILTWFDEEFSEEESIHIIAEKVVNRIIEQKLSEAVLKEIGVESIISLWRNSKRHERRDNMEPGRKRFNNNSLNSEESFWEMPVYVDGTWKSFGNLVKSDCQNLAKEYKIRELGNRKWRILYENIAKKFPNGEQLLQSTLTPEQIRSIFAEQGLEPEAIKA